MPYPFTGQLNSNEIFATIYNMIISQQVFTDPIKGTYSRLMEENRVDGGLYGDTKLYYSTDALQSEAWGNDAEATNLLQLHRPKAPQCQAITMSIFRQISLTVDNYLSKRAWGTEGAFASFNSVMIGWIRDTKRVYDATLFNSYIGTAETAVGEQNETISVPTNTDPETQARIQAQTIAEAVANLFVSLTDVSRDYNDYGNLRSYSEDDIIIVWNSEWVNRITKLDLPTIFHNDRLIKKFGDYVLPARYFGKKNASGGTVAASNTTIRSLVEKVYTVSEVDYHVFPGDLLPDGATYAANETYTVDNTIAFKVMYRRSVPLMSAFSVGSTFWNPKSLTENHYLTWGHNPLEYLKEYPFITVRVTESS